MPLSRAVQANRTLSKNCKIRSMLSLKIRMLSAKMLTKSAKTYLLLLRTSQNLRENQRLSKDTKGRPTSLDKFLSMTRSFKNSVAVMMHNKPSVSKRGLWMI
jgi:GTP1/Obg family GTP-binding protein